MQGYHLSFKDKGKGYENPNLVLHDPDGAQHPDGSHRQGDSRQLSRWQSKNESRFGLVDLKVGSSPDSRVNP